MTIDHNFVAAINKSVNANRECGGSHKHAAKNHIEIGHANDYGDLKRPRLGIYKHLLRLSNCEDSHSCIGQ